MKKILLIMILLSGFNSFAHKFYISIANMEYDSIENRIVCSLQMTAHDFELVLERKFDRDIDIETVKDSSEVDSYIQQYLNQNFQLFSANKRLKMNYMGREVNVRDELLFYFYFSDVADFKTIKIINKLLFSISDQQQNIVHYKYLDRMKSVTLIPANSEAQITFNEDE